MRIVFLMSICVILVVLVLYQHESPGVTKIVIEDFAHSLVALFTG